MTEKKRPDLLELRTRILDGWVPTNRELDRMGAAELEIAIEALDEAYGRNLRELAAMGAKVFPPIKQTLTAGTYNLQTKQFVSEEKINIDVDEHDNAHAHSVWNLEKKRWEKSK